MPSPSARSALIVVCACAVALGAEAQSAKATQDLSRDEQEAFLKRAKVVHSRELSGGITRPLRLTMTDGTLTHDAVFQTIEEKRTVFVPARGPTEINFVDSWRYNIAAYRLAGLLGLESMMPLTVEYRWQGKIGSLSWWVDAQMDERTRLKKKVKPPNPLAWNHDMYRMRVFAELVEDTDRNLGNVLISPDWRVIMLDFTRAFRLHEQIRTKEIEHCDRRLFAALQALTDEGLQAAAGQYLSGFEIRSVLKRRDLLVSHVNQLVAQRGEAKVLY